MKPILYIVIPCYNEEEVLPITKDLFLNKLKELISKEKISDSSREIQILSLKEPLLKAFIKF